MASPPAAAQALDVLNLLGHRGGPLPASVIAAELKLPQSSVYRLLTVLQSRGFVVHLRDEHRFGLGVAALELGSAFTRQEPLRWIARIMLSRLVSETTHNGHLAALDGRDTLYLLEERAAERASLVSEVGVRLPAHLTASGLAMLAALPVQQVRALWPSRHDLARRTELGPRSLCEFHAELVATRRRGYAVEDGTVTIGFSSVAAPIGDHNGFPLAAVALTFPTEQVSDAERRALADQMRDVAVAIARQLRGRPITGGPDAFLGA